MFITMLGDMTAFLSLVFGYFFYWTVHADFPPDADTPGPGLLWPLLAPALLLAAWLRRCWRAAGTGRAGRRRCAALVAAVALAGLGGAALLAGPWPNGLDPTAHVYPAIVWVL